jgi:2-polyprenyl-6-methoxyphenol hydroxylase-like FAD-dependent oxidoreductase
VQEYLTSLDQDEQIHCGPIEWLDLDEWRSGRVVPIGDAANACSPMMGQGGCMATEDAVVLAETLGLG